MNMTSVVNLESTVDGKINFPFKAWAKKRIIRINYLFNDDYADGVRPSHMSNGTVVDDESALNGKALVMPKGYGISDIPIVAGKNYVINLRVRNDISGGLRYIHIGPIESTNPGWASDYFGMLLFSHNNYDAWSNKVFLPYNAGPVRGNPGGYVTMKVELTYLGGEAWNVKEYYQDELVSDTTKYFGTVHMTWYVSSDNSVYIDSFSIAETPGNAA